MIIDNIKNISYYSNIGERIFKALSYLKKNDFSKMKDGKYEIDGENVYALINRYETKPQNKGVWESHRKYIDVQFVARGMEKIGYSYLKNMEITEEYNEEKDIQFLTGSGDYLLLKAGTFAILYPQDVHMPGILINEHKSVLKVVIKVKID